MIVAIVLHANTTTLSKIKPSKLNSVKWILHEIILVTAGPNHAVSSQRVGHMSAQTSRQRTTDGPMSRATNDAHASPATSRQSYADPSSIEIREVPSDHFYQCSSTAPPP